eukprot:Skav211090  [mRNA]  locus=scaffold2002:291509:301495:- [translate_table: standard]
MQLIEDSQWNGLPRTQQWRQLDTTQSQQHTETQREPQRVHGRGTHGQVKESHRSQPDLQEPPQWHQEDPPAAQIEAQKEAQKKA